MALAVFIKLKYFTISHSDQIKKALNEKIQENMKNISNQSGLNSYTALKNSV